MPSTSRLGSSIQPLSEAAWHFAAQTLAARYDADPSAADWRRFGRLPGFTNCKPKYKRPDGLSPFVRLRGHTGGQYRQAENLRGRDHKSSTKHESRSLKPDAAGFSFSREGSEVIQPVPRTLPDIQQVPGRPAAADIAFCVAAYANDMCDASINKGDYETRTEWHRVYAWSNLSKFAKTLQKGQLIILEGTLRYREVTEDVEGQPSKHRIAEIHSISMKRLSKVEAADDPSDGAGDE